MKLEREKGCTAAMAMLSYSCSFSNPPYKFSPNTQFSFSISHFSASTPRFSPFSSKLFRNGNWVSQRNRFKAKSVDPDVDPRFSREKDAVSSGGNGVTPSTNFLSVLCPLLKLFSVRLSTPLLFPFDCFLN